MAESSPLDTITLPCNHTYHRECFLRWLHFDNDTCPLCRAPVDLAGVEPWTWRLRNIAVRTRCSPESLRLGLRPDGWFNIQLQAIPPAGRNVAGIKYVFHPAFSLNKLEVSHPPFDLVMKLVSNAVDLVIEVTCTDGSRFTFVHSLIKELCNRVYFEGIFNGSADGEKIISADHYFDGILETYHRPKDYYGVEMEPPPRFRERRSGNAFTRFFNNLFNG